LCIHLSIYERKGLANVVTFKCLVCLGYIDISFVSPGTTHRCLDESNFDQEWFLEHRQPGSPQDSPELHEPGGLVGVAILRLFQWLVQVFGGQQLFHIPGYFANGEIVADLRDTIPRFDLPTRHYGQDLHVKVRWIVVCGTLGSHTGNYIKNIFQHLRILLIY